MKYYLIVKLSKSVAPSATLATEHAVIKIKKLPIGLPFDPSRACNDEEAIARACMAFNVDVTGARVTRCGLTATSRVIIFEGVTLGNAATKESEEFTISAARRILEQAKMLGIELQ